MENKIIKTPSGELSWAIPNQIAREIYINAKNLADIKEHTRLLTENFMIGNEPIISLADIRQMKKSPSKEVRDYLVSKEIVDITKASAILINNGLSKIIGNIFLKFSKPAFPTKLFTDEQQALEWLKTFL